MHEADKREQPERSPELQELMRLAYLYHAVGNYDKSEEIVYEISHIEERIRRNKRRRDAA